ncbi:hypothetical protein AGABI2DRAFT_195491 [Agaricus bisporus var. bisporus H97]|uniref:hypothetical protein n=1 Tax=Agaricus bisporus var. bisporus (strain H97 / ATCC MYA-4626 / FGSC 10389) TaxID=936046 RepID=UPI00029F78E1|nr:hypothetical protein AGABI2DRAFT_195491 [Agaricus bisporus var. bisporus H97]EKV43326.1 hypothetical protein AGABI2DRAFT_195491 [Agaricus bisporus var. bisporus H97]
MTRAHPRSVLELFKLVNHHRTYFPELPPLSKRIEVAHKSNYPKLMELFKETLEVQVERIVNLAFPAQP